MQVAVLVLLLLTNVGVSASLLWTIVEFIMYLVKDDKFNWWSVGTVLICYFSYFLLSLWEALLKEQKLQQFTHVNYTGKFQERLEAMQKQRKNN